MLTDSRRIQVLRAALLLVAGVSAIALPETLPAAPHEGLLADRAGIDRDLLASQFPAPLFLERASLNRELRDWPSALRDLNRARQFGASAPDVWRGRAEVFLAQGDPGQAERAATEALATQSEDPEILALRARARMAQGLFELAADDYGRAIAASPRRPLDLIHAQALALESVPVDGHRRALEVLTRGVADGGPATSLLLAAFRQELALGDHGAALARLETLRSQGWSEAQYGLLAGDVWSDAADDAAASEAWRRGLAALDEQPVRRRTTRAALRLRADLQRRLTGSQR